MTYNWQFREIYRLTDALAFIRLKSNLLHIWSRPENEAIDYIDPSVPLEREETNN